MSKIVKTYHGKSCIRCGHTERYVSTGHCRPCNKVYLKKDRDENPEKKKAIDKKYRAENPKKIKALRKKYHAENPKKIKTLRKKWNDENPKLNAYYCANRRAMIKRQTPPWSDMKLIKEIYLNRPDGYHVDHKHSLSAGGLHVHWNLEAIPAHDNLVKGSKML